MVNSRHDEVAKNLNIKLTFRCVCASVTADLRELSWLFLSGCLCVILSTGKSVGQTASGQHPPVFRTLLLGIIISFSHSIGSFIGGNTSFRLSMRHVHPDFEIALIIRCFSSSLGWDHECKLCERHVGMLSVIRRINQVFKLQHHMRLMLLLFKTQYESGGTSIICCILLLTYNKKQSLLLQISHNAMR